MTGTTPSPSILILRLSSLGDIILTTPLLSALRAKYPESTIDMVVAKEYESLAHLLPGLSSVLIFDKATGIKGLHAFRRMLKRRGYTHVLDLHNNLRTRFLRNGIAPLVSIVDKRTLKRWLLVRYKYDLPKTEPDVIGRYFETAQALGVRDTGLPPTLCAHAERDPKRIVLAPGARHWNKRWPTEYFVELARALAARGFEIELHGSAADRELTTQIAASLENDSVYNYAGELRIDEAALRIACARLAITNDSGLMHVAQAVGVSVISLFGPTVRQFGFAPRSAESIVLEVEGLYCRPCTAIGLDHCPEKHFRCMREIEPRQVIESIDRLAATLS